MGIKTTAPTHADLAVRVNAGLMVGASGLLLLGVLPRLAASLLVASLVPTSLVGHQFWKKEGPERKQQLVHFLKRSCGKLGEASSDHALHPPDIRKNGIAIPVYGGSAADAKSLHLIPDMSVLKNAATIGGLLLLAEPPAECDVVEAE